MQGKGEEIPDISQRLGATSFLGVPAGYSAVTAIATLDGIKVLPYAQFAFQVVGITTGTIVPQGTIDDTNWVTAGVKDTTGAAVTSITADGIFYPLGLCYLPAWRE